MALAQYNEGRTTMAESIKPNNEHDYPVLIFCPEPGFKPSFFKEIKNKTKQARSSNLRNVDKYIWKIAQYKEVLLKNVSSIPEVYNNMSYKLGEDWKMYMLPYSVIDSVKRY